MSRFPFRLAAGALAGTLLASGAAAEPPPPAPQNPSPMVERTREHRRVDRREPPGRRWELALPAGGTASLFVPAGALEADAVDLVVHFHGAAWLVEDAVARQERPLAVLAVHLGAGSGVYRMRFEGAAAFASLLAAAKERLAPRKVRRIWLTAFSAGFGAVREILRTEAEGSIAGVLLLDGLHTSYVPERKVLAEGGVLDSSALAPFVAFAERAVAGEVRFVITHSEIFPGTFASTTETADAILDALQMRRTPVLEWGPVGMQLLSRTSAGRFEVLGFAGNSAPDHVDHFHGMSEFLGILLD